MDKNSIILAADRAIKALEQIETKGQRNREYMTIVYNTLQYTISELSKPEEVRKEEDDGGQNDRRAERGSDRQAAANN